MCVFLEFWCLRRAQKGVSITCSRSFLRVMRLSLGSSCNSASHWVRGLGKLGIWWPLEREKPVGSTAGKNSKSPMAQKGHKRYLPLIFCEHQDHHWIQRTILHHILLFGCLNCDNDRENTHNSFVLVICKITAKMHCITRTTWLGFVGFALALVF